MRRFERIVIVDWSAASARSPARPSADAIWIGAARADGTAEPPLYRRTRAEAVATLRAMAEAALAAGERLLIGADFPFGWPAGLAAALTGRPQALALWDWLAEAVQDGPDNRNNRFDVAARINAGLPGVGPFWGRPEGLDLPGLPARGSEREGHGLPERRAVEGRVASAQPCWKLYTTGSVGSQALTGVAALARLRAALPGAVAVWPFEPWQDAPVVLAEVYPSLLAAEVRAALAADPAAVKDAAQVRLLAGALARLSAEGGLGALLAPQAEAATLREEGWILGVGHEAALRAAAVPAPLAPPRLKDDCFALPPGVDWTPVDEALALLRDRLGPVTGVETVAVAQALGRALAGDAVARRSNPPAANAAVDGYGFAAAATGAGPQTLPLLAGRAAAGGPYAGAVPAGCALRILTGAILPEGVDTVVLEEDCATDGARVAFNGPVKPRANTRKAGEDIAAGAVALPAGHVLRAPDLAFLTAAGLAAVAVRARLRVGVLSTGDEVVPDPGPDPLPAHRIPDANRPMLLGMAARWGWEAVDLGHVGDDRAALAARLDGAAGRCDAILTSGGASAGDEDHVSAALRDAGALTAWRIAVKPGRPLALGLWRGVPVFGLPGNPVAAFVCALVFARPALSLLAGEGWAEPMGFTVPAAFEKTKRAGRREYLRARLTADGRAEAFASEGSGRIGGLSWASGLVELEDGPRRIAPGDPVRFLPYAGFGL